MKELKAFVKENEAELFSLLESLAKIPAPSGKEEKRAEFVRAWLASVGAEGAYIDGAKNVVLPICCDGSDGISVVCAHTDTVFPDTEPMPYLDDGEKIRCPGIGDDTASLSVMLMAAKYFVQNKIKPEGGLLFVANSCEEGLGNLRGTKEIFKNYGGRIKRFVSFDCNIDTVYDRCVGSHRYEVSVKTRGGHSYQSFGNKNAIAELSGIVEKIYSIVPPKKDGCRTTYNVGAISGGTSVNTIAQSASMLCEYRSDDVDALGYMKNEFFSIFNAARNDEVEIEVKTVGERPCAKGVDNGEIAELVALADKTVFEVTGEKIKTKSASTDCNIPLSLGIPAICVGVYSGGGAHTREEWINKASLIPGLEIGLKISLALAGKNV